MGFFLIFQLLILVTGALGGRFDHEAGNINVLYRFPKVRIILLSDECLIYLLPKACQHEIIIQSSVEGPHCGLIPIGMPSATTTTNGLQWDLCESDLPSKYSSLSIYLDQLTFWEVRSTHIYNLFLCPHDSWEVLANFL